RRRGRNHAARPGRPHGAIIRGRDFTASGEYSPEAVTLLTCVGAKARLVPTRSRSPTICIFMTNSASSSPLGVCVLPQTPPNAPHTGANAQYLHEILAHAGTPYRTLALDE